MSQPFGQRVVVEEIPFSTIEMGSLVYIYLDGKGFEFRIEGKIRRTENNWSEFSVHVGNYGVKCPSAYFKFEEKQVICVEKFRDELQIVLRLD